ncbi:MAG TPA: alkaline phosphatase family protein [Candidatus Baltobacteraceae bacterium]|jgi:hypothetical protein|nr:alkaline phosphatase family protein [Candidatus Baltobacteraceae bacterium]
MFRHQIGVVAFILTAFAVTGCGGESKTPQTPRGAAGQNSFSSSARFAAPFGTIVPDRIAIIVMENHNFDEIVGRTGANGLTLLAPYLTQLAQNDRLATLAFGVSQPSLPNYLSLLSGDSFGIHDDNASCYAVPAITPCDSFDKSNLVDSLEAAGISWAGYFQSMPHAGFMGNRYPTRGDGLYRQKHNPFPYFKDIATNPKRVAKMKTFVQLFNDINNFSMPRFSFIVPDECHDMHGSVPFCPAPGLIQAGDSEVQQLVQAMLQSGFFTQRSLIFITFDEGDFSNMGCCDSPPQLGGGHIPMIIVAGVPGAITSAVPYNQYSILSTIETLWNLPKLGYTSDTANVKPMLDLVP